MTEREDYAYSIELELNCVLTESEKNQLIIQMGQVLTKVLGKEPKSGVTNIYSKKISKNISNLYLP